MDRTALPPGTRFGEMELVRVLASGGFGIVYLARDHWLDRDVAVKEFLPTHLAGRGDGLAVEMRTDAATDAFAQGLQSFIAEAKLLAHFSHPAIVKVHRFWEANGTGYMVMPYLRGPTLGQVRRSMSRPPTEAWLRSIMNPLMGALAMLHAEGVYHRDISPDNVLVAENGQPVLLDFGAARSIGNDRSHSPTAILKPRFAPIEQYAEATHLRQGPWTDIYSLGALIAYLIDGSAPPQSTARSIDDEMKPLQERRGTGMSRTFLSAIDWALSVRPQDRPQSIAELRDALEGHPPGADLGDGIRQVTVRELRHYPDGPFPATMQLKRRPAPTKTHERAGRAALAVLGIAALTIAIAPPAPGPLAAPSERELAPPRAPAIVQAKEKIEPKVTPVPSAALTPAVALPGSTSTSTSTSTSKATADDAPIAATAVPAPPAKPAKKRAARPPAPVVAGNPARQCATSGFFWRGACMQRVCKELRFRADARCEPFQRQARLEHY